jgi:hypothetical protein
MFQLKQPLDVIDKWPYYEFEDYMKLLNDRNEEERKQREEDEKKQSQMGNYGDIMKNVKMPNINIPNVK